MPQTLPIPTQHLLIPRGDDYEYKISFCHGTELLYDVPASTIPTRIYIAPISSNMTIGQKLKHQGGELTLTQNLAPTDISAMVASVPFKILKGTGFAGNPIDITGWQGFSSIRSAFDSPTSWNAVCTVADAINGTFSILFPRTVTGLIPSNCSIVQLSEIPKFSLDDALTWGKLLKQSYVWEFDTIDTLNRRASRTEGRVLVSSGVTA